MKLSYENLEVWQISKELVKDVYSLALKFPKTEEFALTSQLKRAATSVCLNIAEGSARGSRKDFQRFLRVSAGSLVEVRTCFDLAVEIGCLKKEDIKFVEGTIEKLYFKIFGLIKSLNSKKIHGSIGSNVSCGSNNYHEVNS